MSYTPDEARALDVADDVSEMFGDRPAPFSPGERVWHRRRRAWFIISGSKRWSYDDEEGKETWEYLECASDYEDRHCTILHSRCQRHARPTPKESA